MSTEFKLRTSVETKSKSVNEMNRKDWTPTKAHCQGQTSCYCMKSSKAISKTKDGIS